MAIYQYKGPKSSLASSSALALNPSSAIFLAYTNKACLYSVGLSRIVEACSLVSRCPSVNAASHHAGRGWSAPFSFPPCSHIVLSMVATAPRLEVELLDLWRPCQALEPFAHHLSPNFTHVNKSASYECAQPEDRWTIGAPF